MRFVWGLAVLLAAAVANGADEDILDLIDELTDSDERVRRVAHDTLVAAGKRAVPELIGALDRKDAFDLQIAAARVLGEMGEPAVPAKAALQRLAGSSNARVAAAAQAALKAIRRARQESDAPAGSALDLKALMANLESADAEVQRKAASALAEMGPDAALAVPPLTRLLGASQIETRIAAAAALGRIGSAAAPAASALIQIGKTSDWRLRFAALDALTGIGNRVVPAVLDAWQEGDRHLNAWLPGVVFALGQSAVPYCVQALKSDQKRMRAAALEAIAALGPSGTLARLEVTPLLKDKTGAVRRAAAMALGRMGEGAVESLPELVEVSQDESSRASLQAVRALGRILRAAGQHPKRSHPVPSSTLRNPIRWGGDWLARHQDADGKWNAVSFMRHDPADDRCDGPGQASYTNGATALALVALIEGGVLPEHQDAARRGLRYLVAQQAADGGIGPREPAHFIYNHGTAAVALTMAWNEIGDPLYQEAAQRAIDYILMARNPDGAWRYQPQDGNNDTSVTGWMVMALRLAEEGGLRVDPAAYAGALRYVDSVTDPNTGRTGYNVRGGQSARPTALLSRFPPARTRAMTAEACLIRYACGEDYRETPALQSGIAECVKMPPNWNPETGDIDMYYWHMATRACYWTGAIPWRQWGKAAGKMIPAHQHPRGSGARTGSWDPIGPWGSDGGRVYSTALMLTCLKCLDCRARPVHRLPPTHSRYRPVLAALRRAARQGDADIRRAAIVALRAVGKA